MHIGNIKTMGKEKLEWMIATNERMGGDWCKIKEYSKLCPICGGKLYSAHITMMQVLDGNNLIHCMNEEHTFFESAYDIKPILYFNNEASETSFKYDKSFEWVDDKWIEIPKEDKK